MAKDRSDRRGGAKPTDPPPVAEKESSRKRAHNPDGTFKADDPSTPDINEAWEPVQSVLPGTDELDSSEYHSQPDTSESLPDYRDALASVADRYVAKSSEPQTQPAPDQPRSDSQTPDKSSEAPPLSPSAKPQAKQGRRLASGQWVTP